MSKSKSISSQVSELQKENDTLKNLKKLFYKACKDEFGYDVPVIHEMLDKQSRYEMRQAEKAAVAAQSNQ